MPAGGLPLVFVLFLVFLAAALWLRGREWREESGLPEGNVIYSDSGAWRPNSLVLHDMELRLAGKPDYLVEQQDGVIIPVEVKSGRAPARPWEGQILQLAAYCLLVDAHFGVRPPYGILQYSDQAFAIDYSLDLEDDLLALLAEMRAMRLEPDVDRDHGSPGRCRSCGVRSACDQRLA